MKKRISIIAILCIVISVSLGWYVHSVTNDSNSGSSQDSVFIEEEEEVIIEKDVPEKYNNEISQESEYIEDYSVVDRVCELAEAIDFTVKLEPLIVSQEENDIYRKAYLQILKNNILSINSEGKTAYFKDLHRIGVEFGLDDFSYYYYDLDGDGLPELGVRGRGYTYILKYDINKNEFLVLYSAPTMYVTILGTGQIWYRDVSHSNIVRDIYLNLNENNEWENVIELQEGLHSDPNKEFTIFHINEYRDIDIEEDYFYRTRERFLNAIENAISPATFDEVFGDLVE